MNKIGKKKIFSILSGLSFNLKDEEKKDEEIENLLNNKNYLVKKYSYQHLLSLLQQILQRMPKNKLGLDEIKAFKKLSSIDEEEIGYISSKICESSKLSSFNENILKIKSYHKNKRVCFFTALFCS